MSTKSKQLAAIVRGKILVHGQKVTARYNSKETIEGVVHIDKGSGVCFFLQNRLEGSTPAGFYGNAAINRGYAGGWQFNPADALSEIQIDMSDFPNAPNGNSTEIKKERSYTQRSQTFYVQIKSSQIVTTGSQSDDYEFVTLIGSGAAAPAGVVKTGDLKPIFSLQAHPDCCGAYMVYGFSQAKKDQPTYSPYHDMTDDDYARIRKLTGLGSGAAKIAHIANFQHWAQDFAVKIGFRPIHTYKNRNSGNMITIYQFD